MPLTGKGLSARTVKMNIDRATICRKHQIGKPFPRRLQSGCALGGYLAGLARTCKVLQELDLCCTEGQLSTEHCD